MANLTFRYWLCILICTVALLKCAFQNQYVLLHFADTEKYLDYIFRWNHRGGAFAVGYGFFAYAASAKLSLWLVALWQSIIGAMVLSKSTKNALGTEQDWPVVLVVFTLVLFTSLSRLASTIMPDFFCGIIALGIYNMLMAKTTKGVLLSAFAVGLLATTHTSLWPILVLLAFTLLPWLFWQKLAIKPKLYSLAPWFFFPIILVLVGNLIVGKRIYLSKTSSIMISSRMAQSGVLEHYLRKNCPRKDISSCFCEYVGKFTTDGQYLFNMAESPLYKIKSLDDWQLAWEDPDVHRQLNVMIGGVLADPTFWPELAVHMFTGWGKNLVNMVYFADNEHFPFFETTLQQLLPADVNDYKNSKQANKAFANVSDYSTIDRYLTSVTYSILLLLIVFRLWSQAPNQLWIAAGSVVSFILIHAFVCGTFSGAHARYADRVNWLLVWLCAVFWLDFIKTKGRPLLTNLQNYLRA